MAIAAIVVVTAVGVAAGCRPDQRPTTADGVPHATAASEVPDLCRMRGVIPERPRLVLMPPDGAPSVSAQGVCVACFAGTQGAWVAGDRATIEVHLGEQRFQIKSDPRSPLRASHALQGVAIGTDAVLLDRGDVWELRRTDRPLRSLAPPKLTPGQTVWHVRQGAEAVTVEVADRHDYERRWRLTLVSLESPPPSSPSPPGLLPIDGANQTRAGWLERSERGVALLGEPPLPMLRLELGDTRDVVKAMLVAGAVVARTHDATIIGRPDGRIERLTSPEQVLHDERRLLRIDTSRRRVETFLQGEWHVVWDVAADHDLGGALLPPGATSTRLRAALAPAHLLIVERVQDPSCQVADHLYVKSFETGAVRTVARDARLRLHPSLAGEGFGWIEAEAGQLGP